MLGALTSNHRATAAVAASKGLKYENDNIISREEDQTTITLLKFEKTIRADKWWFDHFSPN